MDRILEGVKALEKKGVFLRCIWGIKEDSPGKIPDSVDKSKHWISSWLPQVELLSHPAVKFGISHCGFGGCVEFFVAQVPILCMPHFGDQPGNAKALVENDAGLHLIPPSAGERPGFNDNDDTFLKPNFTAQHFADCAKQLIEDPKFQLGCLKLRCAAETQGGANKAIRVIESTYV